MDGHGKNKYFIAKNKGKLNLVEKKEKNVHYKYMWQLVYEHPKTVLIPTELWLDIKSPD